MTDAGWFRDPQDPNSEIYFDGVGWTSYRRPAPQPAASTTPGWSAPAAPPSTEWSAPPTTLAPVMGEPWAMPAPSPRKRKGRLIALGAVVLLAAAGVATWLAWPAADAPTLTYAGKPIDHAGRLLDTAESRLTDYVKSRHGARNDQTRCYYVRPRTPATGAKKTDVADHLSCGPVLFVDGVAAKPFVDVPVSSDGRGGKKATLTLPAQFTDLPSLPAPAHAELVRPDGRAAPAGSAGLAVPAPPPSVKDIVTTATLGPVPAPKSLTDARLVGRDTGLVVDAAGVVPRYGQGDEARSAPAGQKLIAFQVNYVDGDVSGTGSTRATLVVDGGTSKPVPDTSGGDEWIIAAVPEASSAALRFDDGGFTQTISLPEGKPGVDNLAVLSRTHRDTVARKSVTIKAEVSNGSASATVTMKTRMGSASLNFWAPGNPDVHAPDGQHALLTTDLDYTDPEQPGHAYGFEPALLRLRLPNGQVLRARNISQRKNRLLNVFTVPAGFTSGTLLVTGSERLSGVTLRISRTTSFPISFPTG